MRSAPRSRNPAHTAIELFSSRHARLGSEHLYSCTILAKIEGQPRPNAANQSMLCCEDRDNVSLPWSKIRLAANQTVGRANAADCGLAQCTWPGAIRAALCGKRH